MSQDGSSLNSDFKEIHNLQERCAQLRMLNVNGLDQTLEEIGHSTEKLVYFVNNSKLSPDLAEEIIHLLQDLMKTSEAIFLASNEYEQRNIECIRDFIKTLHICSTLHREVHQRSGSHSENCLHLSSRCLIDGILSLKRLVEASSSFRDAIPNVFGEMSKLLVKLCTSASCNGTKYHVGIIKIYMEIVKTTMNIQATLIEFIHIDAMCSHLMKYLLQNLQEEQTEFPPKAAAFYLNILLQLMEMKGIKLSPLEDDSELSIRLAAKLRYIQASPNHYLASELIDIKNIWILCRHSINSSEPLCAGRLLLICDVLLNDINNADVISLLRLILNSTEIIFKYILLRVEDKNLFDYTVNVFCIGLSTLKTLAEFEDELLKAAMEERISCKQLFCRDVLKLLMMRWPYAFGEYGELFHSSVEPFEFPCLVENKWTTEAISNFLEQCFSTSSVKNEDISKLTHILTSVYPCNPTSALILAFSLIKLSSHIDVLNIQDLLAVLKHCLCILDGNVSNDCLIVATSIFLSNLGKKPFSDIKDIRIRSAVLKIGEKLFKSGRKIGTLFGFAALFSFIKTVDQTDLALQMAQNVSEDLSKMLQKQIDENEWSNMMEMFIEVNNEKCREEPLQNEYFEAQITKPNEDTKRSDGRKHATVSKNESPVKKLCKLVLIIEQLECLSKEDRILLKLCLEKLQRCVNKR